MIFTSDQNETIHRFFENLEFKGASIDPNVDYLNFKSFMNMIDFEDRWIYHGSLTEPPCTEGVYWNVIRTVFPIRLEDLESIKRKLLMIAEMD